MSNDSAAPDAIEEVQVRIVRGGRCDIRISDVFKFLLGETIDQPRAPGTSASRAELIVSRTFTCAATLYGTVAFVAEIFQTGTVSVGAGVNIGMAVPSAHQLYRVQWPKFLEFCRARRAQEGVAPINEGAAAGNGAIRLMAASPPRAPVDYWVMFAEYAGPDRTSSFDPALDCILREFKSLDIDATRSTVANISVKDTFNQLMYWFGCGEKEFWTKSVAAIRITVEDMRSKLT